MIDHEHKCIFIEVPKNSSSSICDWLSGIDRNDFNEQSWQARRMELRDGHKFPFVAKEEYSPHWEDYFKFAVIRNPYERVLSAYTMLAQSKLHCQVDMDFAKKIKRFESFSDFCKGYLDKTILHTHYINPDIWMDTPYFITSHFLPQNYWVNPLVDYASDIFVVRQETLIKDLTGVGERLGLNIDRFPHRNSSRHGDYRQYYDEETIQIVYNKYRQDISLFDYRF